MFKLMWSMKKKGAKPHYKPGTDEKYKKYQEEVEIEEKYKSYKQDVLKRDKAAKRGLKTGKAGSAKARRRRRSKPGGTEKLSDVNKAAERKSMQSVGGFRGVHGASRKSKSAQGPAARVEYRRKSPADTPKSAAPKGTFYALQKRIKEDWKPEIEVIDTKARAKKAEKKRKEAESSLPPHLRLDAMKKAFAHTNEEKQITPMQDNNLFGNAYAGTPPPKKKKKLKEASFADYMAQAQAARERQQKKQDDRKKRDAEFVDRQKHGIKFYDKKGRGRIVKGRKVYDR